MGVMLAVITLLYASVGIFVIIGYIPTIRDLARRTASANISSYVIWTFCGGITFLYALLAISDLLLEIVTGLNFACCAVILALALRLKYRKQ